MSKTIVKPNESLDDSIKRWKRDVSREGTLAEVKKKEYFLKPGAARRERIRANRSKKH
ncbi:MAG: 30S ribosomal protein S21 [Acholeplasmatales bacterium]|jgi:small subunit ribosomal protein S21|nr:30S ribosomal protein S21 [Acholeplasmatales bacterium]